MAGEIYRKDFTGPGSSYTRGVGTFRDTQAVRVGHVYMPDMTSIGLKAAVDKAITIDGTTHPNNSSLQLQRATAIRLDAHLVRIQMAYGYRSSSVPVASSNALVRSDSGYFSFTSWRKPTAFDGSGRPAGGYNFRHVGDENRINRPPTPINYNLPSQIVRIPAVLSTNPTNAVLAKLGESNSDEVVFAGATYPIRSVRFESLWIEPVEVDGSVVHRTEYTFVFRRSLWVVELEPVWNGSAWAPDPSATVDTHYAGSCPTSTFAGAFPVNS